MQTWLQDLRYAVRMLRKNTALTVVIIASLAIGIGANSAIFTVVDALLLRPLPYPQPDRLAAVWIHSPGIGIMRDWPSPGQYNDLQTENHSFDQMAIAQSRSYTLTGRERPERVAVMRTQSTLLTMLGAKPLLGRLLLPENDVPGKQLVAVLTERVWKRLFSADPAIVGRSITLNGRQLIVAGVLRPEFMVNNEIMPSEGPMDKVDLYVPLPLDVEFLKRRGDENYNIMVRLKPGVTVQQAQADADQIAGRIRVKDKRDRTFGMRVIGLQEQVVGDVRRALLVLLGSVSLVLLIACANVANLLLTRAAGRQKEVAIRTALGAGWQRLVRQLLTESLLLSALGGIAGLGIAQLSLKLVRTMKPGNIPRLDDIAIDGTVLLFTFGISLLTGILFGIAPAWRAVRTDLNTSLKAGGRSGQSDGGLALGRNRLRALLVVSEMALSLMLLIGAGLLVRSFIRLQSVPPGFTSDNVITMQVSISGAKYQQRPAWLQFYQEVESRVAHLPGVKAEGVATVLPLTGSVGWGSVNIEGYNPPPGQELQVDIRNASGDYFKAMEIRLVKGRFFNQHDTPEVQQAVIIDEQFAQRFWPGGDAIGKHLWLDPKKPFTIVGVVGNVKQYGLDADSKIAMYMAQSQNPASSVFLVARTTSNAAALANSIVREIHAVDADVPVYEIQTMSERLHQSMARQRFSSTMLSAFALFALLLAAVGIYGVMSYLVTQSTHDIGVRVALGAGPGNIIGLVVREGMQLVAIGIVAGLLGAMALTRVMSTLLFGVSARDGLTFGAVALLLALVALAATVIPARRATRVDPMVALREE